MTYLERLAEVAQRNHSISLHCNSNRLARCTLTVYADCADPMNHRHYEGDTLEEVISRAYRYEVQAK